VQPLRIVLDPSLRTPPGARILAPPGRACLVCADDITADVLRPLADLAEILRLPRGADGLDLPALLAALAAREVNELHLEGGPRFNGHWLRQGLVDELLLYVAPRLIGPGRPLADLPALDRLDGGPAFLPVESRTLDVDTRWILRRHLSACFTVQRPPVQGLRLSL
jgi:diaminohydroxyphosphoribosylaminopyrimidine deaminase/5-amino-6-(5-phosphoribosylamino)uracil reductase